MRFWSTSWLGPAALSALAVLGELSSLWRASLLISSPRVFLGSPAWFVMGALIASVGCADVMVATDGGPDGGADGGGGDSGLVVTPPDIEWLAEGAPPIMLAPCPDGWREVRGGAVPECDPYPEAGAQSCDMGEAHFPGELGCRPIGEPCPSGEYAASVPTGGVVVYVNATASTGGDGSFAAPFAGLPEVPWASLTAETTVALGKGTYPGTLPLRAGVTVIGACAAETTLTGLAAPVPSVVSVTSAGEPAVVRNLTIRGAPQRGAVVESSRRLSLRGVLIAEVRAAGIVAEGPGTEVSLADVVIRGTEASGPSALEAGIGLRLGDGAEASATRFVVDGVRFIGVAASGAGSLVTLRDALITGTRPHENDGTGGRGINIDGGSHLDATGVLVIANRDIGIFASDAGSQVTLTDVIVQGTESQQSDGGGGRGIEVARGAALVATRLLVSANRDAGVFAAGEGSTVVGTDVVIRDTTLSEDGAIGGRGVGLQSGARFEGTRFLSAGNADQGIFVSLPGTVASVTDGLIQHTGSDTGLLVAGYGAEVQGGARFDASRLVITDAQSVGLFVSGEGTTAGLSDVVVQDTRSQRDDQRFGRGIEGQLGARIDGVRVRVEESAELGVLAITGATVVLSDTLISSVRVADCASSTCPPRHLGHGAGAYSASLSLTQFQVTSAAVCGVMVASGGRESAAPSLDLEVGAVTRSEIGACVQVDGYDLSRLTQEVRFYDNGTNLESTSLPVPDLAEPTRL